MISKRVNARPTVTEDLDVFVVGRLTRYSAPAPMKRLSTLPSLKR